ncbi:MAG: hypothetical protein FWF25_08035 [Propionibacteriaceae bacterium]|nr:hypothetical protein [Propionibacteriaceae bacterium]
MVATTPLLFIPEELRSDGTVQLLRSLERVYSFASRDAAQAQHELDQLEKDEDDPLRSFLIWLAAAFIAGKGNDTGGLHGALDHVGASLGKMSASPFSVRACDSARLVAVQFSDYKDEKHLSELMLSQARVLYARLGTPEAARDLAVSLQNLARVYVQTGEVELAQEYLQRAVDKLAEVDKLLNTSESQVELERAIMMCQQAHVQKS